jgi:hypothetical protein
MFGLLIDIKFGNIYKQEIDVLLKLRPDDLNDWFLRVHTT